MDKESLKIEDFHIEYPATDGRVIGLPDVLKGKRYVWRETIAVAKINIQAPQYRLLNPKSVTDNEDNVPK